MELTGYNQSELCEIYNNLNSWKWDDRIGTKPKDFEKLPAYNGKWYHRLFRRKTKYEVLIPAMNLIKSLVSEKELLRYHHLNNLGSTNEAFEQWWKTGRLSFPNSMRE